MNPMMNFMPGFQAQPRFPATPSLYVGDLDEHTQDEDLYTLFSKFGKLHFVRIMRDHEGKSRGFGFVNFVAPQSVDRALAEAQYEKIHDKPIRIMLKTSVRTLPTDSNVFINNLDKNVTKKELVDFLSEAGNVLSVRIACASSGQSLGYAYAQFESKEHANRAIELKNGKKLKENEVRLEIFKKKDQRTSGEQNEEILQQKMVYAKNFPEDLDSEEKVDQYIRKVFSPFGKIESLRCQKHPVKGKFSAFILFEDLEAANKAVQHFQQKAEVLAGNIKPFHVNFLQSKVQRKRELEKELEKKKTTNLYFKNLKLDLTEEQLKQAVEVFGVITSIALRSWTSKDGQKKAKSGFAAFATHESAKRALEQISGNANFSHLFEAGEIQYVNWFQSRNERKGYLKKFLASQRRFAGNQGMPMGQIPQANPMSMPRNMGMPPFNPMQMMNFMGGHFRTPNFPAMHNLKPKRAPQFNPANRGGRNEQRGGHHPRQFAHPQQQQQHQQQQHHQIPHHSQQQQQQQHVQPQQRPVPQERPFPTTNKQPVLSQPQKWSVQSLRDNLQEFLGLDDNRKRQVLGELLFPRVLQLSDEEIAPKITGMLIDLDVLGVEEILEFLDNPEVLKERVEEASDLILNEGQ